MKTIKQDTPIEEFQKLSPIQKKALLKLRLKSALDLLRYFPQRYGEATSTKSIEYLTQGENAVVFGKISNLKTAKTFKSRTAISSASIEDATGKVGLVWFNQPYIAKMYLIDSLVRIEGKVSQKKTGELYFSNPKIEKVSKIPDGTSDTLFVGEDFSNMSPVYPESRGITSNWIHHAIQRIFSRGILEEIIDPIPEYILKKYNLPTIKTALVWIHSPRKKEDAEIARKRFAFEEIFFVQLDRQKERFLAQKEKSFVISKTKKEIGDFVKNFPFPLTNAQNKSIGAILSDMKKGHPMSRLLEGDVGSGKTAVASVASFAIITTVPPNREVGNLQVAYMAPTEILAEQHFESFIEFFKKYKIQVGLITGSGAKKFPSKTDREIWTKISKPQLLKWVENGEIGVLIGTHSLIQKTVKFKNLGLIIIDEQHRFGVSQRRALARGKMQNETQTHAEQKTSSNSTKISASSTRQSASIPHLLSMTATPIPRTLALTMFGDLDLSLLDELPKGRQIPETKIVLPNERDEVYEKIREEINLGRQTYVICPRVNDPDPDNEKAINAKSVKSEVERLQTKIFPEFKIKGITGKDKPKEKEEIMRDFKANKFHILVATSVVEVGVNVPNATLMIIENAERFGLAQLHQLRGRILRSSHKPHCFVFADSQSDKTIKRLKSFVNAKNGFELAEADMQQRGIGDLVGAKQWGVSDLAMEALKNIKMVEFAKVEARDLIEKDFELKNYPLLARHLASKSVVHME
jgi:ATP-dependent DNA helicase RecG